MELLVGVIIGAVVVWLAPGLVGGIFRPAAKGAIKGGATAYKAVAGVVSEAGQSVGHMVAEAKSEMSDESPKPEVVAERPKRRRKK